MINDSGLYRRGRKPYQLFSYLSSRYLSQFPTHISYLHSKSCASFLPVQSISITLFWLCVALFLYIYVSLLRDNSNFHQIHRFLKHTDMDTDGVNLFLPSATEIASGKMEAFKKRMINMSLEEIIDQGNNLLTNFDDPFFEGGMTIKEKAFLAVIEANASSVFEWGMGSSTVLAATQGIKRLSSVDSVEKWVQDCAIKIGETNMINDSYSYSLFYVNIGPLQEWGWPSNDKYKDIWPLYSSAVQSETEPYDVYLVDGRFRVACALQGLLHGHDNSIVIMHDFHREEYYVILEVAQPIYERVRLLVALQRKPNITDEDILHLYQEYQYEPDRERRAAKVSDEERESRPPLEPNGITRIPIPNPNTGEEVKWATRPIRV